jgi:hypothetical protein
MVFPVMSGKHSSDNTIPEFTLDICFSFPRLGQITYWASRIQLVMRSHKASSDIVYYAVSVANYKIDTCSCWLQLDHADAANGSSCAIAWRLRNHY